MNKPPIPSRTELSPLQKILKSARPDWISIGLFSCAINLLMLTGPLFMLQVYDRVLASRSIPTLVVLYLLIVFLFALLGVFNFYRTRMLSRIGHRIEKSLMNNAQAFRIRGQTDPLLRQVNPVSDIARVRQFVGGRGIAAFFDLPWVPIYIGVVFILHPWLGYLTVAGVIVITLFTLINENLSRKNWRTQRNGSLRVANSRKRAVKVLMQSYPWA